MVPGRPTRLHPALMLHVFAVIPAFLLLYMWISMGGWTDAQTVSVYSYAFAVLSLWMILSWQWQTGSSFNPYTMFVISAILFNGGQIWLYAFGLMPGGILNGQFPDEILAQSILMILIGLLSLHAGAMIGRGSDGNIADPTPGRTEDPHESRALLTAAALLICVSIVPAFTNLAEAVQLVNASGYMGFVQRQMQLGFAHSSELLADFMMPASLFLLASGRRQKGWVGLSLLFVSLYVLSQFYLGNRGGATMSLFAYMWLWHRRVSRIPGWLLAGAGGLLVAVAFPLIRAARSLSGPHRGAIGNLTGLYESIQSPVASAISEMGNSLNTVAYTLTFVPGVRDFDWGLGYLYALLTIIPNFYWDIHPSTEYGSPSHWLVQLANPGWAAQGGGMGYSFIAEAFANFGWVGIAPVLFAVGYALGKFAGWAEKGGSPSKLAAIACFMVIFPQYARGDAALIVRTLVWYSLFPYLAVWLLRYFYNAKNEAERRLKTGERST